RLLQARGTDVCHLFASGRRAPSRFRDERVHLRDDEGLLADVRELSGTDPRVLGDPEVVRMALPALRADYRAAETYRYAPGPPLTCPIT
ncbi:thioesterase, partial [Streptomyces sp. SID6648]|nr:thioesterase [Streptomyces sp. SID6648]